MTDPSSPDHDTSTELADAQRQGDDAPAPPDPEVDTDLQAPAVPPPGNYRARAGGYFRNVRLIFVAVTFGMGLWFLYDGFVKYPEQRAEYRRLDVEVRQIDPISQPEEYQRAIAERDQHRDRTDADILLQRLLGITLPLVAILLLGRWLYISRGEIRLDENDTLHVPGHAPIPFDQIRWMDDDRWDRKGIAIVHCGGEGREDSVKLDDFVYERGPVDMIHDRLRHLLDVREGRGADLMEMPVACPKCHSTHLATNSSGFSIVKGVAGALLIGPLGLVAGAHGSSRIQITCLKCGHVFSPGNGSVKPPRPVTGSSATGDEGSQSA